MTSAFPPVRKLKPTRRSVSGYYPFHGNSTPIPYESALERDFLIVTDFIHNVVQFHPQPLSIPFLHGNGRTYSYTPDFLVEFGPDHQTGERPSPLLVEVKYQDEWKQNWREWSAKWKTARRGARKRGWRFRIMDDARIRDNSLAIWSALERYRLAPTEPEIQRIAEIALKESRGMCAGELASILAPHTGETQALFHVWRLVAHRTLCCSTDHALNASTRIWRRKHG